MPIVNANIIGHYATSAAAALLLALFSSQSLTADLMASSASIEQCSLTGGSESSRAMSVFLTAEASHTLIPFIFSVTSEDEAMAEPHPCVSTNVQKS